MQSEIIKLGNSRGLRIPKAILKQCGMKRLVNMEVSENSLIITPCTEPRTGWDEAFQFMAHNKEDKLLDTDSIAHSWDDEEWQW